MAETKAKPVTKTERKKPVRTAPAQKDYPTKLAWLKAMTEHEEAEATKATAAKVARLDKRLASARSAVANATVKVIELEAERAKLVPVEEEPTDVGMSKGEPELVPDEPEADQPQG
ncbi:MAG TPA: hypothetical protein PLB21_00505 [Actinomycetota bacterium]|nr:hypothetical protein [Actinomycetota bacterium]